MKLPSLRHWWAYGTWRPCEICSPPRRPKGYRGRHRGNPVAADRIANEPKETDYDYA